MGCTRGVVRIPCGISSGSRMRLSCAMGVSRAYLACASRGSPTGHVPPESGICEAYRQPCAPGASCVITCVPRVRRTCPPWDGVSTPRDTCKCFVFVFACTWGASYAHHRRPARSLGASLVLFSCVGAHSRYPCVSVCTSCGSLHVPRGAYRRSMRTSRPACMRILGTLCAYRERLVRTRARRFAPCVSHVLSVR